jgi:hypothetical protein
VGVEELVEPVNYIEDRICKDHQHIDYHKNKVKFHETPPKIKRETFTQRSRVERFALDPQRSLLPRCRGRGML